MRSLAASALVVLLGAGPAMAEPTSVTIAGSLQSEVGCLGDWPRRAP